MLQRYMQHETLEEYQCLLPASNQTKTKKPQTLPLFIAKTVSHNPSLHQVHEHSPSVFF